MKETQALIQRVKRVNDTHQHIYLAVDSSLNGLKAGQAVLAQREGAGWMPYLRDLWFPVTIEKTTFAVEISIRERYEPGEVINLIGIIGKPFRFRRTLRNVLLIAVDTPPTALIMPIAPLLINHVSVTLLLLGSAADYGTEHLPAEVEVLKGDGDLNWANRVTTIGWADQVFVTVAQADEMTYFRRVWALFRELRNDIPAGYLNGVFRPPMPCGVGACQACLLKVNGGVIALCEDGPSLDLTDIKLD
jgi:hypothetical protein